MLTQQTLIGLHQQGSDIDLCLEAPQLSHGDRLRLMAAVDDLLLPWRVGQCIWRQP